MSRATVVASLLLLAGCPDSAAQSRAGPDATSPPPKAAMDASAASSAPATRGDAETAAAPKISRAPSRESDLLGAKGLDRCVQDADCTLMGTPDQCGMMGVNQSKVLEAVELLKPHMKPKCFGPGGYGVAKCENGRCVFEFTRKAPD